MSRLMRAWRVLRGVEPEQIPITLEATLEPLRLETLRLGSDDREILRSIAVALRNIDRKTPNPRVRWVLCDHDERDE